MSKINLGQQTAQAIVNQEPKKAMANPVNANDVKTLLEHLHLVSDIPNSIKYAETFSARQPTNEEKEWVENFDALFVNTQYGRMPVLVLEEAKSDIHFKKIKYGSEIRDDTGNLSEAYMVSLVYNYDDNTIQANVYDF